MADGYNPFQGVLNPNMRQSGLWDLRMMSAANRMETPFERGMRTSYGSHMASDPMLGGMAAMANEPDYSSFTYDPALRQQAINAGVQPLAPEQVKHNTILPNTGFFGNHPRLSGALEGALYGAAASHGGMTVGESIQGVAEGVIGGQRMRQGAYRQQFARPFEAAGMLAGLQDHAEMRKYREKEMQHIDSEMDIQQQRIALDQQRQQLGLDKILATRPYTEPVSGQTYMFKETQDHLPTLTEPWTASGQMGWVPETAGGQIQRAYGSRRANDLSMGTKEQLRIAGKDPEDPNLSTADIAAANRKSVQQQVNVAGSRTGAEDQSKIPYQNYQAARSRHEEDLKGLDAQKRRLQEPAHQQWAKDEIFAQRQAEMQNAPTHWWQSGKRYPKDYLTNITPQDVQQHIQQYNSQIDQQIQQKEQDFKQQWGGVATASPPEAPPRKTGSTSKNKIPTYNPNTGQLE